MTTEDVHALHRHVGERRQGARRIVPRPSRPTAPDDLVGSGVQEEHESDDALRREWGIDDPDLTRWISAEERAARANPARVLAIRRAAGIGGLLLALMGVTVWVGWLLDIPAIVQLLPGTVTMKWWTATCFVTLGLAIALPVARDERRTRVAAGVLAALTALVGLSFVIEAATGLNIGHDNPFGFDTTIGGTPGRMAQSTAICFVLLGLSLALHKTGRVGLAQAIAVVPAALGFFAVLGYLFGVSSLYSVARSASMAVHTGFGLLVAGLAVLGLRADRGHMAVVSGNSAGGRLARRLLPIAIVVPPALGWIAITLLGRQTIDAPFALAMVATVMSLLGAVGVWIEASNLSELDVQRAGTVAALHRVRAAESRQAALAVELEAINRHREAILHSALDAFIGLDSDGRITSWNPAAERLYGWSAAEAVGARIDELLTVFVADGRRVAARVDGRFLEQVSQRPAAEYTVVCKDGSRAEVESRIWSQDDGGTRSYTALVRDVADRRGADRALHELNRSLDEFAAVAAHDLRGPIAAMRGYVELIEDEALERDDRDELRIVERIRGATDRGLQLIDDLLAYSRQGRTDLRAARVDTAQLAAAATADVRARVERPCRFEVGPLPPVSGDEGALRQVFTNLLFNAVHYCPDDREPRVVVGAEPATDKAQVTLTVTDNGAGVPEAERESIFEMFQRGTSCDGRSGTGVGLALCRRVVERHGGTICVGPAPGGGSRFSFTLPRHFDPPDPTA